MNPIQSLQHMLDRLARTNSNLPRLAESGVFDELTLEAVMVFQRDLGLPVTGVVNQRTWDAITAAYYLNLLQSDIPPLLGVFPGGSHKVSGQESSPEVFIVQVMLNSLLPEIVNLERTEVNGRNSDATRRNLRIIQQLTGLDVTGNLDRATWAFLSHLYRALVVRRAFHTLAL